MRRKAEQIRDRVRNRGRKSESSTSPREQASAHPGYKVIAISVYSGQAESVDRAARELLDAGFIKANRSFVIQTAIQRLQEDLEGKSREEILKYFLERQIRRPLARAEQRKREQTDESRGATESVGP